MLTRAALNSTHAADKALGHFISRPNPLDRKVNSKPSTYIDQRARQADNLGWWPGKPLLYDHEGKRLVNRFRPPPPPPLDRPDPVLWLDHMEWLIPSQPEREHLLDVLAYNVQHLEGKVNHAIVLGGGIRTGKDLLLQPLSKWLRSSYVNVKHEELDSAFQHYLKGAKFLAVQEARDLSFEQGFTRYNAFKTIIAAPPEELTINEKFLRPYKSRPGSGDLPHQLPERRLLRGQGRWALLRDLVACCAARWWLLRAAWQLRRAAVHGRSRILGPA